MLGNRLPSGKGLFSAVGRLVTLEHCSAGVQVSIYARWARARVQRAVFPRFPTQSPTLPIACQWSRQLGVSRWPC